MTQTQQKPYTIENQSQFPFLTKMGQFRKAKQHGQNQKTWDSFLKQSGLLFAKWFNWTGPEFILVEMDQKNRSVKFYQQHSSVKYFSRLSQRKVKANLIFSQVRNFNEKIEISLKKNFINGAISPSFAYNWIKYNQLQAQEELDRVIRFGVKFDLRKWLNNSLTTNQKKIFFKIQNHLKNPNLPFQKCQTTLYSANRANYHHSNDNNKPIGQSIVKRSSDILGYSFTAYNQKYGLQVGLNGGYDYFHNYNFNQMILKYGNFLQYEKHVIEMSLRAGAVFGKDLMQNDLLSRNKSRWNDDQSVRFINTRLNFIFKNFHPIFGGVFQIVPFFYLDGSISQNLKQSKTKYELDYGIGLRFLNVGLTLDTSLIRVGKNLDEINPSFRIIF